MDKKEINNPYNITDMIENLVLVARNLNLHPNLINKYEKDMIIREPDYLHATYIHGPMLENCRFTILSNQFQDLSITDSFGEGLCITEKNSYFKVLDKFTTPDGQKTQITLLQLPSEKWEIFKDITYITEKKFVEVARANFLVNLNANPFENILSDKFVENFRKPIGMDESGNFYPVENI